MKQNNKIFGMTLATLAQLTTEELMIVTSGGTNSARGFPADRMRNTTKAEPSPNWELIWGQNVPKDGPFKHGYFIFMKDCWAWVWISDPPLLRMEVQVLVLN